MADAVQDLLFLAKRLQGIIGLADVLTTKDALANSITEHQNTLKSLKDSIEQNKKELSNSISAVSSTKAEQAKLVKDAKAQSDLTINEAKETASNIIQEAKDKADKLLTTVNSSMSSIEDKISEKKKELEVHNQNVTIVTKKLEDLNKELINLKAKF